MRANTFVLLGLIVYPLQQQGVGIELDMPPALRQRYSSEVEAIRVATRSTERRMQPLFGVAPSFPLRLWSSEKSDAPVVTRVSGRPGFSIDLGALGRAPERLSVLLAYEFFREIHPRFLRSEPGGGRGTELEERLFLEGLASYASHRAYPGLPAWRYGCHPDVPESSCQRFVAHESELAAKCLAALAEPATSPALSDGEIRYLSYRLTKSLEGRLDPKSIILLRADEFRKDLRSRLVAKTGVAP